MLGQFETEFEEVGTVGGILILLVLGLDATGDRGVTSMEGKALSQTKGSEIVSKEDWAVI